MGHTRNVRMKPKGEEISQFHHVHYFNVLLFNMFKLPTAALSATPLSLSSCSETGSYPTVQAFNTLKMSVPTARVYRQQPQTRRKARTGPNNEIMLARTRPNNEIML